jgi:hypothetical protein
MTSLLGKRVLLQFPVDTTFVPEGWEKNAEKRRERKERAERVRRELWKLGQEALKKEGGRWKGHEVSCGETHQIMEILVISHGNFLAYLVGSKSE